MRGYVLRKGKHLHSVQELETVVELLAKHGFQSRESLASLTDNLAQELTIPTKLASALRSEATKRLKSSSSVQTIQELGQPGQSLSPRQNELEHRSSTYRHLLHVGSDLYPPAELERMARTLEENRYVTRESLESLTDVIAANMNIPPRLAALLRDSVEHRDSGRRPSRTSSTRSCSPPTSSRCSLNGSSSGGPVLKRQMFNSVFMPAPLHQGSNVASVGASASSSGPVSPRTSLTQSNGGLTPRSMAKLQFDRRVPAKPAWSSPRSSLKSSMSSPRSSLNVTSKTSMQRSSLNLGKSSPKRIQ